jgi:predicted RNA binding protein YcfA (HicA-like mRNA interferase family)
VKLPRDVSGATLASLLRRYEYQVTRQTGSHLRLTSTTKGREHHVTVPQHEEIRVGTLASTLTEVAAYLEMSREDLAQDLFE